MNKIKMMIWGREFNLNITYDCYTNEHILKSQEEAVQEFSVMSEEIENSIDRVKEYCLLNNKEEIGTDEIENIFKYIAPKYLFVPRVEKKRVVAIMCNYRFNLESGIAIVFENGKYKEIGKQEIVL